MKREKKVEVRRYVYWMASVVLVVAAIYLFLTFALWLPRGAHLTDILEIGGFLAKCTFTAIIGIWSVIQIGETILMRARNLSRKE